MILVYNYNKKSKIFEWCWNHITMWLMLKLGPTISDKHLIFIRTKLFFLVSKVSWFFRRKLAIYFG